MVLPSFILSLAHAGIYRWELDDGDDDDDDDDDDDGDDDDDDDEDDDGAPGARLLPADAVQQRHGGGGGRQEGGEEEPLLCPLQETRFLQGSVSGSLCYIQHLLASIYNDVDIIHLLEIY